MFQSTSNYHARKFGVRAAMPGFIGKKLCPELVIVPLHFDKYASVSKQVKGILGTFDPNFCSVSLDEAYLDLTEHVMKRQSLSEKERSIICRTCDNLDTNFCLCDLNETIGVTCGEDGSVKVEVTSPGVCNTCRKPIPEFELVTFGLTVEEAVKEMRCRIQQKTCLTASAGTAAYHIIKYQSLFLYIFFSFSNKHIEWRIKLMYGYYDFCRNSS